MMNILEINVKRLVFFASSLLFISFLIHIIFALDAFTQSLIGLVGLWSMVAAIVSFLLWLYILDINRKSSTRTQTLYYISGIAFFTIILYLRYINPALGTGVTVASIAAVYSTSLIILTILKRKESSYLAMLKPWLFLFLLIITLFVLVQYF
jgi:hypothetical protein